MRLALACTLMGLAASAWPSPEDDLIRALEAIARDDVATAEARLEPLLAMRPRFHLAHLVHADLLSARAGRAPVMASVDSTPELELLRAEARRRLQGSAERLAELPDAILKVPESLDTLLVADVAQSRLTWFERTAERLAPKDDYYLSIGRLGAGKQRAWDRRTPLGIYFIVARMEDDELAERYGSLAFPVDYPNAWDRIRRRTGDGIWLHGVDRAGYSRPPLDSDGCLVISNRHLETLAPSLETGRTPVLIVRDASARATLDEQSRAGLVRELEATIEQWRSAWQSGDVERWLRHYADEFVPPALNRSDWEAARAAALTAGTVERVGVDDLLLVSYPEEDGLIMARFALTIRASGGTRETLKRLYLRRDETGRLRIVAAANG